MSWNEISTKMIVWCLYILVMLVIIFIVDCIVGFIKDKRERTDIIDFFNSLNKNDIVFSICEKANMNNYNHEDEFINDRKNAMIRCIYDWIDDEGYLYSDTPYRRVEKILKEEINKTPNKWIIEYIIKDYYRENKDSRVN